MNDISLTAPVNNVNATGTGKAAVTRIYLDNAATTPLDPQVLQAMLPYLQDHFGNPSSIYSYGRETRLAIENARKSVAKALGARPSEIFFTSGGTESNNTAITAAIRDLGCRHIITSPIEHHAVLHTVEHYAAANAVTLSMVRLTSDGSVDLADLAAQLEAKKAEGVQTLVTLMHANNEIGTLLPLKEVGAICEKFDAIFHSDCVQTVGHYPLNLENIFVHFISGAGHKFHGPKGVGVLYVSNRVSIKPFIFGGGQERNMRAGTENVYGIVGFTKALELFMAHYEQDSAYILELKKYMADRLRATIPGVRFNCSNDGLYTVLSVSFPKSEKAEFLLFNLDINNICVSGGSACSSGASVGSHVISALHPETDSVTVRFSFSKFNTKEEVDLVVGKLQELL
ncbi:cysteine desulfurase family protein [Paracnuella aquatica]|uniref:cysteine desulfurase family protein n=1 Tax=Paracnuella aquatica TaxID=2268757 RepID=UPI000DEEAAD8|nr:cysteine desulfurase family protein [Paracnuella aquatica]RPD51779.1 cysteine desulfurase [Paracnuella aquatica]